MTLLPLLVGGLYGLYLWHQWAVEKDKQDEEARLYTWRLMRKWFEVK